MGRLRHLKETFQVNLPLIQSSNSEWVILNYNSKDELDDWIKDKDVVYAKTTRPPFYHRSHSRNVAALLTSGDIICNLDADNFLSQGFMDFIQNVPPNAFLRPPFAGSGAGRVAFHRTDFIRLGGYDERMEGWGYEDLDLVARFCASGLQAIDIPPEIITFINHSNEERTENERIKALWECYNTNRALSKESIQNQSLVANGGKWGRETLSINFAEEVEIGVG